VIAVDLCIFVGGQQSNPVKFTIYTKTMPTATPAALTLTVDQKEVLVDIEVDIAKLLLVNNHDIDPGLPVDGYSSGHYLLFVEGTQEQHIAFYKKMYATATTPDLAIKIRGLWVYGSPSARFNNAENKVTVS
jgi:hypothetical protein